MNNREVTRIALALLLPLALVLGGCGDDDDPTNPAPEANPFAGAWNVVFAGTFTGNTTATIDEDGSCSLVVALSSGGNSFTNTITFDVAEDGSVSNGTILFEGNAIGTVTGSFAGNSGNGDYTSTNPSTGTWSATRR